MKKSFAALLLCFGILHQAFAGDFTVTPVRLYFGAKERAIAVTVTNNADSPLTMQADLFEWRQEPDGKDVLIPTEDLFLSPPIVTIPANSRQVVRLARISDGPLAPGDLSTYRMIVREIPEAVVEKNLTVRIALAFSLPVFIPPESPLRRIECEVKRLTADTVRAVCSNKGNVYALIAQLTLASSDGKAMVSQDIGGGYILPGATRSFDIKRQNGKIPVGSARLEVLLDDFSQVSHDVSLGD